MTPYIVSVPSERVVIAYAEWKKLDEQPEATLMADGWTLPSLHFAHLYEAHAASLEVAMISGSVLPFQPPLGSRHRVSWRCRGLFPMNIKGASRVGRRKASETERREEHRVPLKLKVAVVYHQHADAATRPTYHGVTNDISLRGISVVVSYNIFNEGDVTLLLAIPPEHVGGAQKIVEVTAKMAYTVYSAEHDGFRIGLSFKEFKRKGKELLKAAMDRRSYGSGREGD